MRRGLGRTPRDCVADKSGRRIQVTDRRTRRIGQYRDFLTCHPLFQPFLVSCHLYLSLFGPPPALFGWIPRPQYLIICYILGALSLHAYLRSRNYLQLSLFPTTHNTHAIKFSQTIGFQQDIWIGQEGRGGKAGKGENARSARNGQVYNRK